METRQEIIIVSSFKTYLSLAPSALAAMLKTPCHLVVAAAIVCSLAGCAALDEKSEIPETTPIEAEVAPSRSPADIQKIAELERQLLREQRQYQAERRRLDLSLKEAQKQNEELQKKVDDLQKKLDALLAIDRDLRSRNRNR
jgi:predicted RNase H-like nuclease (RuvC/YqgF family)